MGYGLSNYFDLIKDAIGEDGLKALNEVQGSNDASRDMKMAILVNAESVRTQRAILALLSELLVEVRNLESLHQEKQRSVLQESGV